MDARASASLIWSGPVGGPLLAQANQATCYLRSSLIFFEQPLFLIEKNTAWEREHKIYSYLSPCLRLHPHVGSSLRLRSSRRIHSIFIVFSFSCNIVQHGTFLPIPIQLTIHHAISQLRSRSAIVLYIKQLVTLEKVTILYILYTYDVHISKTKMQYIYKMTIVLFLIFPPFICNCLKSCKSFLISTFMRKSFT